MANEISFVERAKFVKNFERKEHGKIILRSTRLCGRLGTQLTSVERLTAEREVAFDSRGRTITQGLKMTEKWRYFLCTASGWTFAWLGWPRKVAVPSPLWDVKIVFPHWHWNEKCIFFLPKNETKTVKVSRAVALIKLCKWASALAGT